MVLVKNWEKYNGRKDIKKPWWFKLSNSILEDPNIYSLTGDEFRAWIYILTLASKHQKSEIHIDRIHAERACNIQWKAIQSVVSKLQRFEIISLKSDDPYVIRTQSVRDPYSRLEENRLEEKRYIAHFEKCASEIYSLYPKKMGKKRGMDKLRTLLKTDIDFQNMKTAINNYTAHLKASSTELRFVKQFDTFMGCWQDWLDPTTGTGQSFDKFYEPTFAPGEWPGEKAAK